MPEGFSFVNLRIASFYAFALRRAGGFLDVYKRQAAASTTASTVLPSSEALAVKPSPGWASALSVAEKSIVTKSRAGMVTPDQMARLSCTVAPAAESTASVSPSPTRALTVRPVAAAFPELTMVNV